VAQLIDAASTPFHRTLLMTLYASGARNAELTRLKISDVDSRRMIIPIQGGKGRQDRDVMLSPILLDELRSHWRCSRKRSSIWLFPGAFARHFQCSPDRLGPQHIREYQAHLFANRKLSPGSVTTHLCALRFFYIQTLKKPWSIADTIFAGYFRVARKNEAARAADAGAWVRSAVVVLTIR
jgi:integrase